MYVELRSFKTKGRIGVINVKKSGGNLDTLDSPVTKTVIIAIFKKQ